MRVAFVSFCILAGLAVVTAGGVVTIGSSKAIAKSLRNSNRRHELLIADKRDNIIAASPAAVAAPATSTSTIVKTSATSSALKLVVLFSLWYGFNAGYNVFNAYMKKDFAYPWASATLQLFVGVLLRALPLWFFKVRKIPNLTVDDILKVLPIAILNALGHFCGVAAMFEKGGGSFTHVIKAAEPVVSVFLGLLVNGIIPKPLTGLSLLPVTYGVAYASTLGNLNFASMSQELTTKVAKLAMASNFAFSMRSILRKNLPGDFQKRTNLDAVNEFAVTSLLSTLLLLPFVLSFENVVQMARTIQNLGPAGQRIFAQNTVLCGLCFYMYNELQNVVLGSLGPVPTAVGNTLKRVVIFVALYFFTAGETFPWPKIVGCAIAIAGCFSFALCDAKKI